MNRVWLVSNAASGSTSASAVAALETVLGECSIIVAGRTAFPADPLPDQAVLVAARVDTAILFAGDGTINAASCKLAAWDGQLLVLPGGTMNMLARTLHGEATAADIVAAAAMSSRAVTVPFVTADGQCAFVGLILGPAATWASVREAVRHGRWRALPRAVAHAWRRTFSRGLRLDGFDTRLQAAFVRPQDDRLVIRAIAARDARAIATLGWGWVRGDWLAADAAREMVADRLVLRQHRPVHALFDGEPRLLRAGTTITVGRSRRMFLSTREEGAA